jgi:hypothetical protein
MVRKIQNELAGPTLGEKFFSDWLGFGCIHLKDLPPGKYEIYVQYAWPIDSAAAPNKI